MKQQIIHFIGITLIASMGAAHAATYTVTTAANLPDGPGSGTFAQAIRDANANPGPDTIVFAIPGDGPHYLVPPVGGFPLIYDDGTTVDGYTQGSSTPTLTDDAKPNTAAITANNNAVIKIVLDGRDDTRYRDMAYVYYNPDPILYGYGSKSDPVIDNRSMANYLNPASNSRERGGFDPSENGLDPSGTPPAYAIGERAILGVYRAQNVTIKGLAFIGQDFDDTGHYSVAVAQDYGLDTTVKDRYTYDNGTSRGFHVAGCWFGIDPGTGLTHGNDIGLAIFRHRDRTDNLTPPRPDVPNGEKFVIGVAPALVTDVAAARAQFNVFTEFGLSIGGEVTRTRLSGNQFLYGAIGALGGNSPEFGRFADTQVPSILYGTDGDGVNDADEGNLFLVPVALYDSNNKDLAFAGNTFGLERNGSRPNYGVRAVDGFSFAGKTRVRFGADFTHVGAADEGNKLYDTQMFAGDSSTADNSAWVSLRGNVLVNNSAIPPLDPAAFAGIYDKFIDVPAGNPITPVITAATTTTLTGTCGIPLAGVAKVVVDIYVSDPEGDTALVPQGKTYITSREVATPSSGAFSFTGLTLTSGTKVTIAANYLKADAAPTITSVIHTNGVTALFVSPPTGPYKILRASVVGGPYTSFPYASFATAAGTPAVFADAAAESFYRLSYVSGSGQTSPFATSFLVP